MIPSSILTSTRSVSQVAINADAFMICVQLMAAITDGSRGSGGCGVSVNPAHHYSPSTCRSLERFCNRTLSILLHASAFIFILIFRVVKWIMCCAGALFQPGHSEHCWFIFFFHQCIPKCGFQTKCLYGS